MRDGMRVRALTGLVMVVALAGCRPAARPVAEPLSAGGISLDTFENPGGMWMPDQLRQHEAILRALGVEVAGTLSDPLGYPLGAIVNFGGCSASFVSPEGLIVTNHHCAISSLQANSTPAENMLEHGFLAQDRLDERPMEAGGRVWVCQEFVDVTDAMTRGLARIKDDLKRQEEIEKRIKQLIGKHEDQAAGQRVLVRGYFEGDLYVMIKQLEIRDVRLVYAPARPIGNFGGEIDNWRWPRHCGDYTFFRAYVGPDGKPADYAAANVPFRPNHHLKIAATPLLDGDAVLVAGFPGRTARLKTGDEARHTLQAVNPLRIALFEQIIARLEELGRQSEELKIKVARRQYGLMNSMQYMTYLQTSLEKHDFLARKDQEMAALRQWIAAEPDRVRAYGTVLDEIARVNQAQWRTSARDIVLNSMIGSVDMLGAAHTLARMAQERPKPDARRDLDYQQRNWEAMVKRQQRLQDSYDRRIDQSLLLFHLGEIGKLAEPWRSELLELVLGRKGMTPEQAVEQVAGWYGQANPIEQVDQRVQWLTEATTAELEASADPILQLALRLAPLLKQNEEEGKQYAGAMAVLRPRYMQALRACAGGMLSPDANGTLRVTYGRVRGSRPEPQAAACEPFTVVSEILKKNTGVEPFDAPGKLLQAIRRGVWGPWVHEGYGEVPVNFLSDLDTTGGNSGSATLNGRGELVGLLFDGTTEGLVSDWLFVPEVNRSIHADFRYVLWVMDYVDRAHGLLEELGFQPASLLPVDAD